MEKILNQHGFYFNEKYQGFLKKTLLFGNVVLIIKDFKICVHFLERKNENLINDFFSGKHEILPTGCTSIFDELEEFLENLKWYEENKM